jgi:hypothetical protein
MEIIATDNILKAIEMMRVQKPQDVKIFGNYHEQ